MTLSTWRVWECELALLLAATALPLHAQSVPDLPLSVGVVAFDGSGTLGAFTGTTRSVRGQLHGGLGLEAVRGWVEADAATLETGSGRRDRDMRSSLEVDEFPTLRFDLDAVGAGEAVGDSTPVALRGRFTIRGVSRETAVRGWVWQTPAGIRFRGATPLNLKEYGIGGLSKFFGTLRMNEDVVIRVDITFAAPAVSPPPR